MKPTKEIEVNWIGSNDLFIEGQHWLQTNTRHFPDGSSKTKRKIIGHVKDGIPF